MHISYITWHNSRTCVPVPVYVSHRHHLFNTSVHHMCPSHVHHMFPSHVGRPADVHLAQVVDGGGLLDERVHLPLHRQRQVQAKAGLGAHLAAQPVLDGAHVRLGLQGKERREREAVMAITLIYIDTMLITYS